MIVEAFEVVEMGAAASVAAASSAPRAPGPPLRVVGLGDAVTDVLAFVSPAALEAAGCAPGGSELASSSAEVEQLLAIAHAHPPPGKAPAPPLRVAGGALQTSLLACL